MPTDRPGARKKAFVDFQNDVTAKDLGLALSEGFRSIEHVKRYTTTGMGTDQGKTSNVNALALVAERLAKPVTEVGTTTFRPPYVPLTFGAIVGHSRGALFDVVRRTPMHDIARGQGGSLRGRSGNGSAPGTSRKPGEDMQAAVRRECAMVRETGGVLDASTLGKIDIQGRDARTFLNRVYTNAWSKLAPGMCRYGLMLRDDGMVYDDGVTACIDDRHFHMTTTTGGAARVLAWLEDLLQTEWPELEVYLTSVTEQWATMAVNGPLAREVLAPLVEDCDLAAEAFRPMAWRTARIAGVEGRIFRISFTGELAFEVNVPADRGAAVLAAILAQGEPNGVELYGTETMHVLRAEKGFIIVGQDTDGTVTPFDLGMDWIVSKTKGDFIGKRGLSRPDLGRRRPPAAGRPLDRQARGRAGGGRPAGRARLRRAPPGTDDRPRHIGLFQPRPRQVDRPRPAAGRPCAARHQAGGADPGRPAARRHGHVADLLRSGRDQAQWLKHRPGNTCAAKPPPGRTPSPHGSVSFSPMLPARQIDRRYPSGHPRSGRRPAPMYELPNDTTSLLRLIEPAPLGKLVLRGNPELVGPAAASHGFSLPEAINTAADGNAGRAIRLGPDEHLLLAEAGRTVELVRSLAEALQDRHHALVDVSARFAAVELVGNLMDAAPAEPARNAADASGSERREQAARPSRTPARDTLTAACPLDLDPAAFVPGQATRTVLGKAEIILDCLGNDHFRLLTNRSFADYVRQLLQEAGREFGLQRDTAA